jgi:hypothetical protein
MADLEKGGEPDDLKGQESLEKTETDGLLPKAEAKADAKSQIEIYSCSTENYKDYPYAVLFVLNIFFLVCCLVTNYDESFFSITSPGAESEIYCNAAGICSTTLVQDASYYTIFMAIGSGIVLSLVWIVLLQFLPTMMVNVGMAFAVVLPGCMAAFAFISGHWYAFGGLLLCFAISFCWWTMVQSRIALAAKMLQISSKFISGHLSLLGVALVSLLLSVVFMMVWASAFYCTMMSMGAIQEDGAPHGAKHTGLGVMCYFFFTYYWTINVFANTVHVVTAGAFSDYWLLGENGNEDKVYQSVKRALTGSFGSICFGSLIISVVQAMVALVRQRDQGEGGCAGFIKCCADCILYCIQEVMDFINTYAFVRVAVHGDDFCTAGAKTWDLIKGSGFDMVVNHDLTQMALTVGAVGGGILGGGATYILARETAEVHDSTLFVLAITGGVITFGCMQLIMSVAMSCVAAIYVLYLESPAQGMKHHPDDVQELIEAWRAAYEDLPWVMRGDTYVIDRDAKAAEPPIQTETEAEEEGSILDQRPEAASRHKDGALGWRREEERKQ